jgi:hypothetical protein
MDRSTLQIQIVRLILLSILVFVGCSSPVPSETNSNTEVSEGGKAPLSELTAADNDGGTGSQSVASVCELMENPTPYAGKQIRVRTTFVRIGSEQWFGDESCVTRHPIFDAEFESSLEDLICNDKTHFSDNLCKIVTPANTPRDIALTAVFSGRFETYQSDREFSRDGHRFRLKVDNLANITDIRHLKNEMRK